jgi:anti-anti-sigma regulatory factor
MTAETVDQLELGDHVCALVDDHEDGLTAIGTMVTAGLRAGEKVLVYTESLRPTAVTDGLTARGVPVAAAERRGQVQVLPARDAYLSAGRFEPRHMLETLAGHIRRATADRYRGLRLVGDMAWATDGPAGIEDLPWYETQVNRLYLDQRALGVCLYDTRVFSRSMLRQVSCAHPSTSTAGAAGTWIALLRIRRTAEPYGLRLYGEVDLSNRRALVAALEAAVDERPDRDAPVVVDVTGLRFVDASTAAMLAANARRAPGVRITGAQGAVRLVLECVGAPHVSTGSAAGIPSGAREPDGRAPAGPAVGYQTEAHHEITGDSGVVG